MDPTLIWFRRDLRLSDNPALSAAAQSDGPVYCVFIHDPDSEGDWSPGEASDWWLHHSLQSLASELKSMGQRLILKTGPTLETLQSLVSSTKAKTVLWNRVYEPAFIERDGKIRKALEESGTKVRSFNGSLLYEPTAHETKAGDPYRVFTPFYKQVLAKSDPHPPFDRPRKIPAPKSFPQSEKLKALDLLPSIDWAGGMREAWEVGETAARADFEQWEEDGVRSYDELRDFPAVDGVSRLSARLHFGELGVRELWHRLDQLARPARGKPRDNIQAYMRQLVWREFAHHLLYHYPHTTTKPLRADFSAFPWRKDQQHLRAWQRGRTGYPIVDAGMRELWTTGWMHNRVRMITASFLVKHLLLPWTEGARWFWDTLVDADLANNTMGWQWVAGSGADAAPYFRIFNPMTQGRRFDPEGDYVRKWIPELAELDNKAIHEPWEAPPLVLESAGVELGRNYPEPIVDHGQARERALQAYALMKSRVKED